MLVLLSFVLLLPAQDEIPRESYEVYLCPVHRDEQAAEPSECPVCEREMVRRFLTPAYSCPMHGHVEEEEPGTCPICRMDLVPTTRELQWYCPESPDDVSPHPGDCSDGSSMRIRSVPMAHGDHNPRHGGVLFMAPNGYHHLEGTLDDDGTVRLYFYNDFTKPIDAGEFEARVGDVELAPEEDGAFLSARIPDPAGYPAEVTAHVSFPGDHEEESRFDFVFTRRMTDAAAEEDTPELALPEFRVPQTSEEIYREIMARDRRLKELIADGVWPDLYIPALEAKDLVLALSDREGERVALPAKKLVRAAWLLDTYGDQGNRVKVEGAYRLFEEAVRELEAVYEP